MDEESGLVSGEGNSSISNIVPNPKIINSKELVVETIISSSCCLKEDIKQQVAPQGGRTSSFISSFPPPKSDECSCCLCRKAGEVVGGFVGDTPLVFCEGCFRAFEKEGREYFNVGDRVLLRFEEADCDTLKSRMVCWRLDGSGRTPFVVEVEGVGD